MLKVAGKPVMDYVLDDLQQLGDVEQVIYITGHLKEKVEEYARTQVLDFPRCSSSRRCRTARRARSRSREPYVDQPVLIIFVDTIFDADLSVVEDDRRRRDHLGEGGRGLPALRRRRHRRGRQHDEDRREAERRRSPSARTSGCTTSRTGSCSTRGSTTCSQQPKNKGEYYLTDAFQYMIDKGAKIKVIDVEGWYDAGKIDTLLETNSTMLEKGARAAAEDRRASVDDHRSRSTSRTTSCSKRAIGPNVSIGRGTVIEKSELTDTIVGSNTKIIGLDAAELADRRLGGASRGCKGELTLGDHSEVRRDGGVIPSRGVIPSGGRRPQSRNREAVR